MSGKKQTTLQVKLSTDLRDAFLSACKNMDTTGAQELRKFMREFAAKHGQRDLAL